ncbi:hypothetical protein [Streptomyces roseochromogenus]|uniref:Aromatic ring-opening dioxygenase LigA n=1 Tax=Streptomyces roseochromogenus subsp. oscitans DS 12.976 TaxID=1352936 RepID=V6JQZ8_STRRC|nr:hypothetical protein [Streptomyces roseochromogenus]EST22345.1 hypothetical protein M878_34930 [Streptomyces roseochromogenus subsp. oscitans DS 12.976]
MTHSTALAPAAAGVSARRRLLRLVAVAACLPYLSLKVAWIAGSHAGIPDGSPLLAHRVTMIVANGLTVLMDAAVVVLALLLTRPWGRRVPAWLLAVPMWIATGLLAPIMAGFPVQLVLHAVHGDGGDGGGDKPFLAGWVFDVVYGGFIVQGLALGALFAAYARDRWGHLWRGRVREMARSGTSAGGWGPAVTVTALALFPAGTRLLWACGGTAGLSPGHPGGRLMDTLMAVSLAAAVLGVWQLALPRAGALPVAVPLALALTGSGAAACWGAWMALGALVTAPDAADRPTPVLTLTYAGQVITGLLVAALATRFFADRSVKDPRCARR